MRRYWPNGSVEKRGLIVESHLVYPRVGCAVMCHGLVSASHLNGLLGEKMRDVKLDGFGTPFDLGCTLKRLVQSQCSSSQRICALPTPIYIS